MSIFEDDTSKSLRFFNGAIDITANVLNGSFSCENILCDEALKFGSCNSARAEMDIINNAAASGDAIIVKYGNDTTLETIGKFWITYTSQKENSEETHITMYDCVKFFDRDIADFYNSLQFPMTLKNLRDSLCDYCGVMQVSQNLINDNATIYETIKPSKLNAMDMLKWIGELNGAFPHASIDGKIKWVILYTDYTEIGANVIQGTNGVSQKDFETYPIQRIVIRNEDGDIGVSYGEGNTYFVTANPLVYGMTSEQLTPIVQRLFSVICDVSYTPTSLTMKCDPTIGIGTRLKYGDTYFYMMSRKTTGMLFDYIECKGKKELTEDTSVNTSIEQLKGKTNILTRDIDETKSRVTSIEDDYTTHTEFTQTANAIQLEIGQIETQLDGNIELFYVHEVPTAENYPQWDWTGMMALDGADVTENPPEGVYYASDELFFLYPTSEKQKKVRSVAYNEDTTITYRFIKMEGQFIWQEVADTETSLILSKLTELELTTDGLTASVSAVAFDLETETQRIDGEVSLKLNTNDLVSEFNAKANVITLTSDHFTLDRYGNITASNADLNGVLVTTGSGVFDFTYEDLTALTNYWRGTGTLNADQLRAYDFDCDGVVGIMDAARLKNHIVYGRALSVASSYVWKSYPIKVTIDASNPTNAIKIEGKDNANKSHTYYIGSNGMNILSVNASKVSTSALQVNDVVNVGGTELEIKEVTINGVVYKILAQ